ncbi:MAG: hypothetical protein ACE5JP_17735 [Candidatus Bipolaricaulia bacterium]
MNATEQKTGNIESQVAPRWEIKTQDGQQLGAHEVSSIVRLIEEGRVEENDFVRSGDMDWESLQKSSLMDEFAVKVLFHPIKAYVSSAAGIGAVIGVLLMGLVGIPLFLVQELNKGIVRAILAGVATIIFISKRRKPVLPV